MSVGVFFGAWSEPEKDVAKRWAQVVVTNAGFRPAQVGSTPTGSTNQKYKHGATRRQRNRAERDC